MIKTKNIAKIYSSKIDSGWFFLFLKVFSNIFSKLFMAFIYFGCKYFTAWIDKRLETKD